MEGEDLYKNAVGWIIGTKDGIYYYVMQHYPESINPYEYLAYGVVLMGDGKYYYFEPEDYGDYSQESLFVLDPEFRKRERRRAIVKLKIPPMSIKKDMVQEAKNRALTQP